MISKQDLLKLSKALNGMPFLGALQGSPAAKAGLRYGDVVLEVNGLPVTDPASYVTAKDQRADGMTVKYFRDGQTLTAELTYDGSYARPQGTDLVCELAAMRILSPADEKETTKAPAQAN